MWNHIVPRDAEAALYFLPGQYLFETFAEEKCSLKALSSEQVTRAFRDLRTDTGWLDRRVLRYREATDGNAIISYLPAKMRTITVEFSDRTEELTIPLPTLILLGKGRDYYLWAATTSNIRRNTTLVIAPLPNIGSQMSGKICFGRNEVPEVHPSTLEAVWRLIFDAPFNHDSVNDKCSSEPADVRNLLARLHQGKMKKFPLDELLASSTTIEDAWATIVEGRRVYY